MIPNWLLSPHYHGALPGASDEILAVAFLLLTALAGWYLTRRSG